MKRCSAKSFKIHECTILVFISHNLHFSRSMLTNFRDQLHDASNPEKALVANLQLYEPGNCYPLIVDKDFRLLSWDAGLTGFGVLLFIVWL